MLRNIKVQNTHSRFSKTDKDELVKKAKMGCKESVQKLVDSHMDMVLKIARQYHYPQLDLADLVSEGVLGIIECAIPNFNFSTNFSSYTYYWILNKISNYTRHNSHMIRHPANMINLAIKVKRYYDKFHKKHNIYPSIYTLCEQFNLSEHKMREILALFHTDISLEFTVNDNGNDLHEILSNSPVNKKKDNSLDIYELLYILDSKERKILEWYFGFEGEGLTTKQIAQKLGLNINKVSFIKNTALKKLKNEVSKSSNLRNKFTSRILSQSQS